MELTEKQNKKLKKLAEDWDKDPSYSFSLNPSELRFLLEHHEPLRQLIRIIAVSNTEAAPLETKTAIPATSSNSKNDKLPGFLEAEQQKVARLEEKQPILENKASKDKESLERALQNLHEQMQVTQDLQACLETAKQAQKKLQTELIASHEECQRLANDLQQEQQHASQLEQQLAGLHKQMTQYQPSAELQFLRSDAVLTSSLGLDLSGSDQQALIVMVSVLAQKDNLERLWDRLKERCDTQKRPASTQEQDLLTAALGWYNHNWQSRPFQLFHPTKGSTFDFEQQQKTKHQTEGEIIKEVWLPGLADSSGKLLRKTIVLTK